MDHPEPTEMKFSDEDLQRSALAFGLNYEDLLSKRRALEERRRSPEWNTLTHVQRFEAYTVDVVLKVSYNRVNVWSSLRTINVGEARRLSQGMAFHGILQQNNATARLGGGGLAVDKLWLVDGAHRFLALRYLVESKAEGMGRFTLENTVLPVTICLPELPLSLAVEYGNSKNYIPIPIHSLAHLQYLTSKIEE